MNKSDNCVDLTDEVEERELTFAEKVKYMDAREKAWRVQKDGTETNPSLHSLFVMEAKKEVHHRICIVIKDLRSNKDEEFKKWNDGYFKSLGDRIDGLAKLVGQKVIKKEIINSEMENCIGTNYDLSNNKISTIIQVDGSLMEYFGAWNKHWDNFKKSFDWIQKRMGNFKKDFCYTAYWTIMDEEFIKDIDEGKSIHYKRNLPPPPPPAPAKKKKVANRQVETYTYNYTINGTTFGIIINNFI